jgi:hypothetical protein
MRFILKKDELLQNLQQLEAREIKHMFLYPSTLTFVFGRSMIEQRIADCDHERTPAIGRDEFIAAVEAIETEHVAIELLPDKQVAIGSVDVRCT